MGTAPAGTWTWMSLFANQSSSSSGAISAQWPRTHDSAAWADSRITSPSWPVIVSLPEPFIAVASMNRTSPPTGVHARPVATPGTLVRRRCSEKNAPLAEQLAGALGRDPDLALRLALGDVAGDLAQHGADLALEVADAGLARVLLDDRLDRGVGELGLRGLEAVGLELARAPGSASRCGASRRPCSRRAGSPPSGPAAAPGTVSSRLAVAMKITSERSNGRSR